MPKVSIIIPAFNARRWLRETLQSACQQSYTDIELLVIDDGSSDGTGDVVREFDDPRIRYLYQANQGLAGARNTGLQLAQGEFIAFLDADDLWHPAMLATTVAYLESHHEVGVVRVGYHYIDDHNQPLAIQPGWYPWEGDVFERLLLDNVFVAIAALTRRDCVEVAGPFDEQLRANEDWDLWLRIAAHRFQFSFIARDLAMYRRHDSNMTLDYERMRTAAMVVLDKVFTQYQSIRNVPHLRGQAYANCLARFCATAFRNNEVDKALRDFQEAVAYDKTILFHLPLYYQVACSSVTLGYMPNRTAVDLERGQHYIQLMTDCIQSLQVYGVSNTEKRKAQSIAYQALGMVAYSHKEDMEKAQEFLTRSISHQSSRRASWIWLGRAWVGRQRVARARGFTRVFAMHRLLRYRRRREI